LLTLIAGLSTDLFGRLSRSLLKDQMWGIDFGKRSIRPRGSNLIK
jgi:hypothetical protein